MAIATTIPVGSSARRAALLSRIGRPLGWLALAWRQATGRRLSRR